MPIGFARLEFVKRSSSKNACAKAAYNSRSRIEFIGHAFLEKKVYNWSKHNPPVYHEILLPDHVDEKFQSPEYLWNAVEQKDNRKNSVTAIEMVLALPDDKVISLEDRQHLARSFVKEHFVDKGLAVQIDIHPPDKKVTLSEDFSEFESKDHNWHAHILATTRRFKENGKELSNHKARDLMPILRGGTVISGTNWGKLWSHHQNTYFDKKGLSLRVDSEGVIPQKHLGPVRMRGRAFSLLHENNTLKELNSLESEDPEKVLAKLTQTKNIFTTEDIDHFLHKHVDSENVFAVRKAFWQQTQIIQLLDPQTQKPLNKFTTQKIIEEEKQTVRLGDRLVSKSALPINPKRAAKFSKNLNSEQQEAFQGIISGQKLSCIEGYAGTGKSHLLNALRQTYQSNNCLVRGLGPDNATASVLKEKGFSSAENIYRFLFAIQNGKRQIIKHKEVWILDEAGKLGTGPLLELLKRANKYGAQVILSGDSKQLPSVSRGSMFRTFSEKYGAQNLQHIQRQHTKTQREIAKKLATGEMGAALDSIVQEGDIKWHPSKEQALESLVTSWALHRHTTPNDSSLILAHSNKEVRALNELARLYRKEAGELIGKEYRCDTFQGKVYISCGDRIEFREKDHDLGISNGTQGVLIKASEHSFTVQILEDGKKRKVTFNPQKFRKFQLGYATTYYRSQGRTIDRAFVLHSPMMNKELFYVGLTRHVKKTELYISEQEAKTLSDVKAQAFRSSITPSTLEYLNHSELQKQDFEKQQSKKLDKLKSSESIFSKVKGYGLSAWIDVRSKTHEVIEKYKDQNPDKAFFNPDLEKSKIGPGKVEEVFEDEIISDKKKMQAEFKKILKTEKLLQLHPVKTQPRERFSNLSKEHKNLLDQYFRGVDRASSLHTIVKADGSERGFPHFTNWQKACGERNERANALISHLKQKDIHKIFKGKSLDVLNDRSAKYLAIQQRKQDSQINYNEKLKDNLDALLHKLFPEGPTGRDKDGLRFGAKGSLKVTCSGPKASCFYDFEQGEGGGPIQLIQKGVLCSQSEAFRWAKDFLGEAHNQVPTHFKVRTPSKDLEWVSTKPDSKHIAPSLKALSQGLARHYNETLRHTYRDEEGNVLFHTLRLEDKHDPKKKIVLPLSYGHNPECDQEPHWSLKGYQANKKPLYNLQLLKEFPHAKVLVVEGEKTADVGAKMFPNEKMICLTWSGGAGAVSKAGWSPLKGREVIIWPDNDKAGFEASDSICDELQQVGVKSLREVDRQLLAQELPSKWDLADALPEDKGPRFVKNTLLRAWKKEVEISYKDLQNQNQIEKHQTQEIQSNKRQTGRGLEL